jgi:hypothetical protein
VSPGIRTRIENVEQPGQAFPQLDRFWQGLVSLRADILLKEPRNFAVFAEGPLDEIRKLQAEISEYATRLEQVATA